MTGLDPVTELTNSTTGKAYKESRDIATFGTKETYQLFKDIKKTFRKSPGYQVILKGVLWKLPIDMAIELFKFAMEVYDDRVAATVQTRTNECVRYGHAEINKYPGELENKDPQLIGFLYQGMVLHRKTDSEQNIGHAQKKALWEEGEREYAIWREFEKGIDFFKQVGPAGRKAIYNYLVQRKAEAELYAYFVRNRQKFVTALGLKERKAYLHTLLEEKKD